jgi:Ca-activated chloride channel family protein
VYEDTTDKIFQTLAKADAQGSDSVLRYVSAFPALEQDVATYNEGNPTMPLVAMYPANGAGDADNPYLILNAPWAKPDRQAVARAFLRYVRGEGRKAFLDAGYRDANRRPGRGLTQANGILPQAARLPRSAPVADSVKESMDTWSQFIT